MTDNVTPIAPMSHCASCGFAVAHEDRFDPTKHGSDCRQPEIRMRRVEGQLGELLGAFQELAAAHNEAIGEILKLKEKVNASTPSPEPETQRSADYFDWRSRPVEIHGPSCSCEACRPRDAHPDDRAAEPDCEEAAGAVHPGEESGRAGGPAEGAG